MAGDWIKMGTGLRSHPKTVRIMSALQADRLRVVGALHAVWCVFDQHSPDGFLAGYTPEVMDSEIGWAGFSAAMMAVGWLNATSEGLSVPEYQEHNGPTAKRRALDTKRKSDIRATPSAESPKTVREMSASEADKMTTREEKRREKKVNTRARTKAQKTPLPEDFCVSERVRLWAEKNNHSLLDRHLESFRLSAAARGYQYVDWDAAFMKAVSEDWAGVRKVNGAPVKDPFAGAIG